MSDTWADGAWVPVLEKGTKRSSSGSLNKPLSWVLSACVASAVQVLGSSSAGFSDVTSVTSLLSSSSLICRTRGFFFLAEDFNCTREAGKVVQQNIQQLKKNPSFFFSESRHNFIPLSSSSSVFSFASSSSSSERWSLKFSPSSSSYSPPSSSSSASSSAKGFFYNQLTGGFFQRIKNTSN